MYVSPKQDCPHILDKDFIDEEKFKEINFLNSKCKNCDEKKENWICLICGEFFCSRYINSHFIKHNEQNKNHSICLSMIDLSFWCYDCDYYIVSKKFDRYYKIVSDMKFGNGFISDINNLKEIFDKLNIDEEKMIDIKYQRMIEYIRLGKIKKISFLTGAGISTSAGIPDFRSNTGLFKQLMEKYNLSTPEEFFHLSTFQNNPEYLYDWAKEFDLDKYQPTITHWFMSYLHSKNLLHIIYTQNIDGLELKAKVAKEKIVFAHGNMSTANCPSCKKVYDIDTLKNYIDKGEILYCDCKTPVKFNVVLYGENLPSDVFMNLENLFSSDLVFIMGTSLKVQPFSLFAYELNQNCSRILVNKEKVGNKGVKGFKFDDLCSNDIFLEGFSDEIVNKIIDDLGWRNDFNEFILKEK